MTADFVSFVRYLFSSAISLSTSFKFPGTNITPLALMLFGMLVVVSLRFLRKFFGGDE